MFGGGGGGGGRGYTFDKTVPEEKEIRCPRKSIVCFFASFYISNNIAWCQSYRWKAYKRVYQNCGNSE